MTTRLDMQCPHCGKHNDMHDTPDGSEKTPQTGDVSICIRCGDLGVFDLKAGRIRKPTPRESREFADDPEIQDARRAWRAMDRYRITIN